MRWGLRGCMKILTSHTEINPAQNWNLAMPEEPFLQTDPSPEWKKISGLMGARFLSSTGLGSSTLIGTAHSAAAHLLSVPALDKHWSPI